MWDIWDEAREAGDLAGHDLRVDMDMIEK